MELPRTKSKDDAPGRGFLGGLFFRALSFAAGLGIWLLRADAAILINLDATTHPLGPLATWTNTGVVPGNFEVPGGATATPTNMLVDGVRGISFVSALSGIGAEGSHYAGPIAPGSVCASNPRAIEAWIFNATSQSNEVVFAWGRRGGDGLNNSFGHGFNTSFGAVHMSGEADIGWGKTAPQVAANRVLNNWTYLVQSFDGTTNSVYVDGRLANSEGPPATLQINTADFDAAFNPIPFRVARQTSADGTVSGAGDGDLIIGRIRVHDVALNSTAISNQFLLEKADFNYKDTDGDGLPDWWEIRHGLDPNLSTGSDGAAGDVDADSVINLHEFQLGTKPNDPDTDDDLLIDAAEINRIDPQTFLPAPTNPLDDDTDDDGLKDGVETDTGVFVSAANTGTNPLNRDSDGDIWSDGFELQLGTNPVGVDQYPPRGLIELNVFIEPPGPLNVWPNSGTLGGTFVVPTNATTPQVATVDGAKGVTFLSTGGVVGGTHYVGPEVPASLTGGGHRTLIAWIHNPTPQADEAIFSWGRFGGNAPDLKNYSVSHGTNNVWGALQVWGQPDLGWEGQEVYHAWSQIALTHDGVTNCAYINGRLVNTETGIVNTAAFAAIAPNSPIDSTNRLRFRIARVNTDTGDPGGGPTGSPGGFTLGGLSVFEMALDGATIRNLFDLDKGYFGLIGPLRIGNIAANPDGSISFSWTGVDPGQTVSIETSTNLVNWTVIASDLIANSYTDYPTNSSSAQRFYRVKSP